MGEMMGILFVWVGGLREGWYWRKKWEERKVAIDI